VSDVFLGLIAVATLAMAIGQIGCSSSCCGCRSGSRPCRRGGARHRPLAERLTSVAENLQHASSLAAVQVERFDRLFAGASKRADATMSLVQGPSSGRSAKGWPSSRPFAASSRGPFDPGQRHRARGVEVRRRGPLFIGDALAAAARAWRAGRQRDAAPRGCHEPFAGETLTAGVRR